MDCSHDRVRLGDRLADGKDKLYISQCFGILWVNVVLAALQRLLDPELLNRKPSTLNPKP